MASQPQALAVLTLADSQVGYREGGGKSNNNYQRYSAETPGLAWSQGMAWCQTFQSWLLYKSNLASLGPVTASCATAVEWFRARNRFSYYPAIGAQVYFGAGGGSHVGIVYKYDATYIYTYEGNTNDNGSAEGDGVYDKKRTRRDSYTYGYGYPAYAEGIITADPAHAVAGSRYKATASMADLGTVVTPPPVVTPPTAELPWVSLRQVVWAAKSSITNEKRVAPGPDNPQDDVELFAAALDSLGLLSKGVTSSGFAHQKGFFDAPMNDAYRLWQESLYGPGDDSDGIPGPDSATKLGAKTKKFQVRDTEGTYVPVYVDTPAPTTPAPAAGKNVAISAKSVTYNRYTGGGTLSEWIKAACAAAGVPYNSYWQKGITTAAGRESGGNPNAVNVWDSNAVTPSGYSKVKDYGDGYFANGSIKALNGTLTHFQCSRGVLQCIPQTFAERHISGTSNNIYDPVASIASAITYVRGRYGVKSDGSNLAANVQQFDPNRSPKGY